MGMDLKIATICLILLPRILREPQAIQPHRSPPTANMCVCRVFAASEDRIRAGRRLYRWSRYYLAAIDRNSAGKVALVAPKERVGYKRAVRGFKQNKCDGARAIGKSRRSNSAFSW